MATKSEPLTGKDQWGNQEGELIEVRGMTFRRVPKKCENCAGSGTVRDPALGLADAFQCAECDGSGQKGYTQERVS